jgi:nucleoside-diphosphate-sugar epimerase
MDGGALAGRVAFVTGAGRGLGVAIAAALAEAGAAVACASRSRDAGEATVRGIRARGGTAAVVALDVTRAEQVRAAVVEAERALGPVDILVNNAGVTLEKATLDVADAEWDDVLATNLTSMFRLARAVAPGMIARGRGKIVNIGSMYGVLGVARYAAYCASKAGVGAPRHPGQLRGAGLHEHRHPAGGHGRPPDAGAPAGQGPGAAARRAGGDRAARRLPGLGGLRLHDGTDAVFRRRPDGRLVRAR